MAKGKSDYINKLYQRFKVKKEKLSPAPAPQMVMPGKWRVTQVDGKDAYVNLQEKHMVVPTIKMSESERKRLHEMGHIRFSFDEPIPDRYKGTVEFESVQAVEDCRINAALQEGKMLIPLSRDDILLWRKFIASEESTSKKIALLYVALSSRFDGSTISARYRTEMNKDCRDILGRKQAEILSATAKEIRQLGYKTWEHGKDRVNYEYSKEFYQSKIIAYAQFLEALFGADKTGDDEVDRALENMLERMKSSDYGHGSRWGKMEIKNYPKPIRSKGSIMLSARTATDMGVSMRYPHRAITDQMVFSRKKRTLGINILVDCSGSMGLNSEDLEKILMIAPASLVAAYNGEGSHGELYIIAEKGRIVKTEVLVEIVDNWTGNIIDGPALEWMATQDGPKIWVSDGYVTGVGDREAANLSAEAVNICRMHKILKINRLEELHSWLLLVKKGA